MLALQTCKIIDIVVEKNDNDTLVMSWIKL